MKAPCLARDFVGQMFSWASDAAAFKTGTARKTHVQAFAAQREEASARLDNFVQTVYVMLVALPTTSEVLKARYLKHEKTAALCRLFSQAISA
jgi:hypothetical protein